jgi:hypothetical protein
VEAEKDIYVLLDASTQGAFVSGRPEIVERVAREGGFLPWPILGNLIIHTPLVEHFYEPIYEAAMACNNKLKSDLSFEIYSAHYMKPIGNTPESLAEYAAAMLTKRCDFHGVLEVVYENGGRVFVDMSTGESCMGWAKETFEDRDTISFSIYPPYIDPKGSMLRLFAKLLSNHINFNSEVFLNTFAYPFMENCEYVKDIAYTSLSAKQSASIPLAYLPGQQPMTPPEPTQISATTAMPTAVPTPVTVVVAETPVATATTQAADPAESLTLVAPGSLNTPFSLLSEEGSAGLFECLSRSYYHNIRSYELFLENEIFLLNLIRNGSKNGSPREDVIWDLEQILEITDGAPSKVWGEQYSALDALSKRARLPLPPFLFVSRITGVNAEFGQFRRSHIDMEYDITDDCAMLLSKNVISYVLLTEMSHVAVLLLAYIGIDMAYDEEISYRILDTSETLHSDIPIREIQYKPALSL